MKMPEPRLTTRRQFLRTSSAAATITATIGAPLILTSRSKAASPGDTLKVGLVGCGGRGSGAAKNALLADASVALTALGDAFPDRVDRGLKNLKTDQEISEKVRVTPENAFSGLDAYEKVIHSGVDVVILATPPGFRPLHLKAAVEAGKHVFCEKPMATDAPGVRSVLESSRKAKEKNLSLVAGFCYRYHAGVRAIMQKIHEGAIGEIRALHTDYNTGLVGGTFPQKAGQSDAEWQMRNWWHFTWLSGDHIVEQAVHSLDKMAWAMKDEPPVKCHAIGGRAVPQGSGIGHIFDHFGVVYEYANGTRGFHLCRQQAGCFSQNHDYIMGADGVAHVVRAMSGPFVIKGKNAWRFRDQRSKDMYQVEHDELFASIRAGKPINDGERMAKSTLLAIMGRMAAYSGQEIAWEDALNSTEVLMPEKLSFETAVKLPVPPIAMPGRTKTS